MDVRERACCIARGLRALLVHPERAARRILRGQLPRAKRLLWRLVEEELRRAPPQDAHP